MTPISLILNCASQIKKDGEQSTSSWDLKCQPRNRMLTHEYMTERSAEHSPTANIWTEVSSSCCAIEWWKTVPSGTSNFRNSNTPQKENCFQNNQTPHCSIPCCKWNLWCFSRSPGSSRQCLSHKIRPATKTITRFLSYSHWRPNLLSVPQIPKPIISAVTP